MRKQMLGAGAVACAMLLPMGHQVFADQPDVGQVLRIAPSQPGLVYDIPSAETASRCKIELLSGKDRGWIVRDGRGLVIRKFVDSNGDGKVDRWSFFMNGQEVYRDIDTNFNEKADECRWYHTAGSRAGVDSNEDGKIDQWTRISAEEVTMEAVSALASGDIDRLRPLLMTGDDVQKLGLSKEVTARLSGALQKAGPLFKQTAATIAGGVWTRFDGHNPMTIPSEEIESTTDLQLYLNGTIMLEVGGQTKFLRVPEVVRVGEIWKISDVPTLIEGNQELTGSGVIVQDMDERIEQKGPEEATDGVVEDDPEIRDLVQKLRQLDEKAPKDDDAKALVAFHTERAGICALVGSKSKKLANREHWYKQVADSYNAAAQTGQYPEGIATLDKYGKKFAEVDWGKGLAPYFIYRAINSQYAVMLNDPKGPPDPAEAQKTFMKQLGDFLTQYPDASDAPDALWQLGNGMELASNEDEAHKYYQELVTKYPNSNFSEKAQGALRRLDSLGQPIRLTGNSLGKSPIDTTQLKGRVVLLSYWATWCQPCVEEMPKLAKLREKYGKAGFEVVGVCLDSDRAKAVAFLREKGYAWPQMWEEGAMESPLASNLGIISLPYLMLIDANGNVLNKNVQFGELEAEMDKVMAQKVASKDKG